LPPLKSIWENAVKGKYKNGDFKGRCCEIQVDNYTIAENENSFASGRIDDNFEKGKLHKFGLKHASRCLRQKH
jgi:hypothetical protein